MDTWPGIFMRQEALRQLDCGYFGFVPMFTELGYTVSGGACDLAGWVWLLVSCPDAELETRSSSGVDGTKYEVDKVVSLVRVLGRYFKSSEQGVLRPPGNILSAR